jgi:O-antigen ligase
MWLAMETLSQKIRKTDMPMLIPIVFFLIMHIVSIFRVPEEQIFGSIQASIVILSCAFFFYFIISYVESERKLYSIVNVMVLSCCLQVIFSIFSFIYYLVVKKVPDLRVEGLLRDYELFAEYLAIHIPLFFFAIRQTKNKKLQFILKCFLAVTIMVLFSTETRGAIISLIIGMGYYLWKMKRVLSVGRIIGMVAAGVLVSVAAYALLAVVVPQSANLIERFQEMDIRSLDTRQVVWESFVDRFRQEPFFGKGVVYDLRSYLFYPHSTYFYYLLTMGIAGLVAYILVVISVLKRGVANLRKAADDPVLYELAIVLNTMLIIFLIDGIKIEYARYSNYQLMIWLIFGLIFVLGSLRRQRSSTN